VPDTVWWIRRDLRLRDNPALAAAVEVARSDGSSVIPLFVQDPALWGPSGDRRRAYLAASLEQLRTDGAVPVQVRRGDPVAEVVGAARDVGAAQVHVAGDFMPYGRRRDGAVERALAEHGIELVCTGSPYAVPPGTIRKPDGTNVQVYTPFFRRWEASGIDRPTPALRSIPWAGSGAGELADVPEVDGLLPAGERSARQRLDRFLESAVAEYDSERERPDHPGTSRLSVSLKYGEIHPRTVLDRTRGMSGPGVETFRKEIAWRDFYADVAFHRPESVREYYKPAMATMRYDTGARAEERFTAWTQGRTGFPIVDAGMRQLANEGWMHNRLRMIVGSFLVKDLHLEWTRGARWFLQQLQDGDLSSNNHGWQWVAGSGTDAAPYFRIFNPVTQGQRYDPDGDYVRRYVDELAHIEGKAVHEPWSIPEGYHHGYPQRIVDHGDERVEALARLAEIRGA
jgi:deoxyribodipyrimidine photo-lyase